MKILPFLGLGKEFRMPYDKELEVINSRNFFRSSWNYENVSVVIIALLLTIKYWALRRNYSKIGKAFSIL